MKTLLAFLLSLCAVGALAQVPAIQRNQFTTNSIPTNTVVSGLSTNKGRVQFQTANTNTYQFGGNGTTMSFFDNVSGITFWSYDHSTDKLTVTLGTQEIVGTIKAQIYQAGSGASGATGTSSDWTIEDGLVTTIGTVGSATPAGNAGAVQLNQGGVLYGTNRLVWDITNNVLRVNGNVVVSNGVTTTILEIARGVGGSSFLQWTTGGVAVMSWRFIGDGGGHTWYDDASNRPIAVYRTDLQTVTLHPTNVVVVHNLSATTFSGSDTGAVSELNFYDATGGGAKRVQLKAAAVINDQSTFTLPTNHMGGNSVGVWISTNASGGTNGQVIIAALGKDLEISSDGKTIQNKLGYVPSAAASVMTVDRTAGKTFIQTNRMTAAQTLVVTNHSVGDYSTIIIPGEAAGGTDRNITVAVAAGDLIQDNDIAPAASLTIVATNGIAWEISVLKSSFRSTNYWKIKRNWSPQ